MSAGLPARRRGGRRRGPGHAEGEQGTERWLVSYADMITVLMALFIVLFAISQIDQGKYEALRESLAQGFQEGQVPGGDGDLQGVSTVTAAATPQPTSAAGSAGTSADPLDGVDPALAAAALTEAANLEQVQEQIRAALAAQGLEGTVEMRIDERGLVVGLVADDVFFAAESAALTPVADQVLDAAGPVLAQIPEDVAVEGHANVLPVSGRYATNWELSADRAVQVLRRLVEHDGVPAARVQAVGYGDAHPLVPGTDDAALTANRRVDLVVLSSAPDAVRALLPALAGGAS